MATRIIVPKLGLGLALRILVEKIKKMRLIGAY